METGEFIQLLEKRRKSIKSYRDTYSDEAITAYRKTLSTKELLGRPDIKYLTGKNDRLVRIYKHAYLASQDLLNLPMMERDNEWSVSRLFKASYFEQTLQLYTKLIELLEGKESPDDEEEKEYKDEEKWKERRNNGGL